jgi:dipeptidyl aminopeptidase/acylaminoacyl peptidase
MTAARDWKTPMTARTRLMCAALLAAMLAACGGERERTDAGDAPAAETGRYTLIPRALLFGDPQRARGRLSPDGATLAWVEPADGVLNIFTAPVDAPEQVRRVTQVRDVGVYEFDWLQNNTHIVYALGRGGSEPQRVHSVDVITGVDRDLAPAGPGIRSWLAATSWDYPDEVVVAANDRDPDYVDLHRVDVVTGASRKIFENDVAGDGERFSFSRLYLDRTLNLVSASRDLPDGGRRLYSVDEDGWRVLGDVGPEDSLTTSFLGYDGTNSASYVIDSRGRDYAALARFDLVTEETRVLAAVAGVDVSDVLLHPTTFEADAALIDGLSVEWLPLTSRAATAFRALDDRLRDPYTVLSRTVDDRLWVVLERGPTNPGVYHLYNRETGRIDRLIDVRPNLAAQRLSPMTPVIIKARDGLELVSYLTLPPGADGDGDGKPETASPLVIVPDLGPQRRAGFGYEPVHQWLADRGYAALSVNVRGAPGFGKAFLAAGDGEIGAGVQNDLRDAAAWAIGRGVADPERMAVFGFWLNGHAALLEAARDDTPFACAAAYNAPVDLVGFVDDVPPYFGEFNAFLRQRLGDPEDPATRARLAELSPLSFAGHLVRSTLIGHGGLDGGAQSALARDMAERARAAGAPLTYVGLAEDAGNLQSPRDRMAFYAVLEAFLAQCLGGKLEPIAADLAATRLDEPIGEELIPALAEALQADVASAPQ